MFTSNTHVSLPDYLRGSPRQFSMGKLDFATGAFDSRAILQGWEDRSGTVELSYRLKSAEAFKLVSVRLDDLGTKALRTMCGEQRKEEVDVREFLELASGPSGKLAGKWLMDLLKKLLTVQQLSDRLALIEEHRAAPEERSELDRKRISASLSSLLEGDLDRLVNRLRGERDGTDIIKLLLASGVDFLVRLGLTALTSEMAPALHRSLRAIQRDPENPREIRDLAARWL